MPGRDHDCGSSGIEREVLAPESGVPSLCTNAKL